MIWALISKLSDILAVVGFVMIMKWTVELTLWINNKWRDRSVPKL